MLNCFPGRGEEEKQGSFLRENQKEFFFPSSSLPIFPESS
jgi:hypothetical protein